MKSVILKNGAEFIIDKAKKEDAKDIIEYLNIIGGESENLLFGANGFPLSTEQEEEVIESKNSSLTSCLMIGRIDGEVASVISLTAPMRERIAHTCEIAIKLYEKLGFEKIGLYKNFFKIDGNYYDEILMNLHL